MISLLSLLSIFAFFVCIYKLYKADLCHGLLLPSRFFAFFCLMTWSPICIYYLRTTAIAGEQLSDHDSVNFLINYFIAFLFFGIGYSLINSEIVCSACKMGESVDSGSILAMVRIATIALCLAYLVDGGTRYYLLSTWKYLLTVGDLSYHEVRREIVYGGLYEMLFVRLQFSLVFVLFCTMSWSFFCRKNIGDLFLAAVLFFVCAISLKKMCFIWYGFAFAGLGLLSLPRTARDRIIPIGIVVSPLVLLLATFYLYRWQYSSNLMVTDDRIFSTMLSRTFVGYPDGFKLYVGLFPDVYPFTYGRDSDFFVPFLGAYPHEHPMSLVPLHYGIETTFPAGWLGASYSSGGVIFVAIISAFVGFWIRFLNGLVVAFSNCWPQFSAPICISVGASTLWLLTKGFPMSFLTGGNFVNSLFFFLVLKLFCFKGLGNVGK